MNSPDYSTRLANASLLLEERDIDQTRELLKPIHTQSSRWSDPFITLWANYLLVCGNNSELDGWLKKTSAQPASLSPDYLYIKGRSLRRNAQLLSAYNVFQQAFELDPVHYQVTAQLAELLRIAGLAKSAEFFEQRGRLIKEYETLCRRLHKSDELPTQQQLQAIVDVCSKLYLFREVTAWLTISNAINPNEDWVNQAFAVYSKEIAASDQRVSKMSTIEQMLKLPEGRLANIEQPTQPVPSGRPTTSQIRFEDEAIRTGIEFVYDSVSNDSIPTRFFEFVWVGVAAIDFDADSYPDIFFTQGGSSPSLGRPDNFDKPAGPEPTDQLFRNHTGVEFKNATVKSGLVDTGYSQGCASDDVNQDGFADLYVANVGSNTLFINNGDGTFSESTWQPLPLWTTSCTIADLSGDGIPDIYDVNHVGATGVHAEMCIEGDSTFPCDMSLMQPEQDRFWEADGAGGFNDATAKFGLIQEDGIGLGIAVADFDDSGNLSAFVANDARPNFFFTRSGKDLPFKNEALARGLAFSAEGRSQACMGVAIADSNADGRLDMFVTNFFADHNTLYQQLDSAFFTDATAQRGLMAPGHNLLGFGTQFLDADLDGDEDLVITNGDIANLTAANSRRPWKQPSQLLCNMGDTFAEISGAGEYFNRPVLGRGLARLDWNRDGLPDFVVSHIGEPAALLTNTTAKSGFFLKIQAIGTKSAKIPFGTSLTLTQGTRSIYRQLTTGCGYQSQNEHVLGFGFAKVDEPFVVKCKWNTLAEFTLQQFAPNTELILLQDGRVYEVPR